MILDQSPETALVTAVTASAMVVTATQAPGRSRPAVEMTAHPEMMTTLSLCQEAPQGRMAVRTSVRQCCGQAVPQSPETASVTVVIFHSSSGFIERCGAKCFKLTL